jgi:hypothetical protein
MARSQATTDDREMAILRCRSCAAVDWHNRGAIVIREGRPTGQRIGALRGVAQESYGPWRCSCGATSEDGGQSQLLDALVTP